MPPRSLSTFRRFASTEWRASPFEAFVMGMPDLEPPPSRAPDRLRIGLLAAPMEPVPPPAYGGTERVVAALAAELSRRGHEVTLFASADSQAPCALEPIATRSLWAEGYRGNISAFLLSAVA